MGIRSAKDGYGGKNPREMAIWHVRGGLMSIDMAYMHMIGTRGHEGHIVVRDDILYGVGLTQYINSYAGM